MSRRRNYSSDTIQIMERFFIALDSLQSAGLLKGGITGFCKNAGIDKRHLYIQRKDLGRGFFEVGWILPLIREYRVSPIWILTGLGAMYS